MGLETGTYLNDLNVANPDGSTDAKSEGDNHIRLIKSTLKATFPGMVGAAWRNQVKAADYALQVTDNMTYIAVTAAATITGTAATLGNGWMCIIYNGHTAAITTPGSNTLQPTESVLVVCTGSIFANFRFSTLGWRQITMSTVSGASSVTLTGGNTSAYKAHKLVFNNVVLSQDAYLAMRMGNSAIDTGNNYLWNYITSNGSTVGNAGSGSTSFAQLSNMIEATSNIIAMEIALRTNSTIGRQFYSHKTGYISSVDASWNQYMLEGYYNGGFDRVQVYPSAGTFSGTFTLYGLL